MSNSTWKRRERDIAKRLDGERVPSSGRARGWAPDVRHPTLSIEVKARKSTPKLLRDAMDQAIQSANKDKDTLGKMPVAILCEHGRPLDTAHVVLRFKDFEALVQKGALE